MLREELDPIKGKKRERERERRSSSQSFCNTIKPQESHNCTNAKLSGDPSHSAKAHIFLFRQMQQAVRLLRLQHRDNPEYQSDFDNHRPAVRCFTCGGVPQKLVVSIYNGRCGCPPQHTSRGHIGVRFRVNVLYTFPWHSWLELWDRRENGIRCNQGSAIY